MPLADACAPPARRGPVAASSSPPRRDDRPRIETILVPVDFSRASREAVVHAERLARAFGATLKLIHVFEPVGWSHRGVLHWLMERGAIREEVPPHDEVKFFADLMMSGRLPGADFEFRVGPAHEEIVLAARELGCDLIVLGAHGESGMARWLIGSTAERVVRSAPCPVLVLRGSASGHPSARNPGGAFDSRRAADAPGPPELGS